MTTLADEPAAPADLAAAAKKLADLYQVITLDGLVGDRNDPLTTMQPRQGSPSKASANDRN